CCNVPWRKRLNDQNDRFQLPVLSIRQSATPIHQRITPSFAHFHPSIHPLSFIPSSICIISNPFHSPPSLSPWLSLSPCLSLPVSLSLSLSLCLSLPGSL